MLSGHYDYVPYGVHVVVGIYMIILFILAVGGNGVIVMAFAKYVTSGVICVVIVVTSYTVDVVYYNVNLLFVLNRPHRSPVNSPHKGQWRGALMFPLICARINGWVNNGEAGKIR